MPNTQHPKTNTLDIRIVNPITCPNWDNLLLSHDDSSFFHSSAWARTLCETYKYKPLYFTVFENNKISALIPVIEVDSPITGKRGVSLPFTDYCNPIFDNDDQFKHLFDYIVAYGGKRDWKYFEFRNEIKCFHDSVSPAMEYFGHILELSKDENKTYAGLRESTKRNIKKAVQQGVHIKFYKSQDALKDYYKLHCITRKRQGIPPQPLTFLKNIHENIISTGAGFIVLGLYNNKVIAGAVFFHSGTTTFFKYGASDLKFQELRANNLVMWDAIKYYARNGYKRFCFGRTDMDNQGLRQFKSGWGTKENVISYYRYDLEKDAFVNKDEKIRPLCNNIFSKMPIPLLKMAGTLLYKHIG